MTPPLEPHWVCEHCGKPYAAQPIACACGAREFVALTLDVGDGTRVGASVKPPKDMGRTVMATIIDLTPEQQAAVAAWAKRLKLEKP